MRSRLLLSVFGRAAASVVVAGMVVSALSVVGGPAAAFAQHTASPATTAPGGAVAAWASSSSDSAHAAVKAIDGDLGSGWQADGSSGWLEIDLGALKSVTSVEQTFASQAVWKFTVLGSVDGHDWATLVDRSAGGSGRTFSNDVDGVWQFLRLVVTGSSTGAAASSAEFSAQTSDGTDIAVAKRVTASSGAGDFPPGKAVDGDTSTYWGATGPSLPQWLQVDLGAPSVLTRVVQNFKDDGTYRFTIDGSLDGGRWTTLFDASAGVQGEQFGKDVSGTYRYVRLTIKGTSSGFWAGSTEFGVYGFENRSLEAGASASSSAAGHVAAAAVDGDASTYWQAASGDANPALTVDLGGLVLLDRVEQTFATAATWRFTLLGSADGENWTSLMVNGPPVRGATYATDASGGYRYLRLIVHAAANDQPPASSRELAAYGTPITRNLAIGVSATTSSFADGHDQSQAIDGDAATSWTAGAADMPQQLTVDLGNVSLLDRVEQTFVTSGRWQFTLEASTDATHWDMLLDDRSGATGQTFGTNVRGSYRYIRLTVLGGPAAASSDELTVTGIGSPVTDKWWEDTSGVRKFYINYYHDTLKGIQGQLDTLKSEGYGAIELTSLPEGWPQPFAGLAALDEFKVDPNAGTMQDFKNLIAAAHARGMRVMFFANLGYPSDHAPFFIQAAKDYHDGVDSDVRSWFIFNPADNASACSAVGSNWHWSDVANVCYFAIWGEGAPAFDWSSPSFRAMATRYVKFWMDTGIDGMTFDAAYNYVNMTIPMNNAVITDTMRTYDGYSRPEGYFGTDAITDRHYDGIEAYSWAYLALNSHNPDGLEGYAKALRDAAVNVHGVMPMPPSWDFPNFTVSQRLLEIATITTTGALFYLDENASDLAQLPQTDIIPKWPAADQETLWQIMRAQNAYQALAPVGARFKVPTNDNSRYYAYVRQSKQGGVRALTITNYQDSPQKISVDLGGTGIGTHQTPIDLVKGGAAPPITSGTYTITLPAYGYAVLGVHAGPSGPPSAEAPVVGGIDPSPVRASSGQPVTVSTTVTNPGTATATNVSANLQVPDGWTATPVEAPTSIDGGATAKFSWRLEASSSTSPGAYQATLAVSYEVEGVVWVGQPTTFSLYLDGDFLDKTNMTATATSWQPGYEPGLAIDGDPSTFWHTEFTPNHALPPQAITIDLGGVHDVYQLTYLPRQDGFPNGDITSYNIYTSSDGQTFTKVASGSWPGDASMKTANFTAKSVRYVRLEGVQGVYDYVNAAEIGIFAGTTG